MDTVEFAHLPKPRYLIPERDARIFEALHLFEVGYDSADGEPLSEPNLRQLDKIFSEYFLDDQSDHEIHVGMIDGQVCAMAQFNPELRLAGHAGIERMTVHPEFRKQGISKRLIGYLGGVALAAGRERLRLRPSDPELERYYVRLGFKRDEIIPNDPLQPYMAIDAEKVLILNRQDAPAELAIAS